LEKLGPFVISMLNNMVNGVEYFHSNEFSIMALPSYQDINVEKAKIKLPILSCYIYLNNFSLLINPIFSVFN